VAEELVLRVKTEEDAWKALQEALQNGVPEDLAPNVKWTGWPHISIYLPDTPEEGSISPSMMEAFLELQRSIFRTHALLSTGTENLRTLKKLEKEQFEFRVKVEKGSSGYTIDLTTIVSKLGNDLIAKMNGTELVITVLGLALMFTSTVVVRAYLSEKTKQKLIDVDDSKTKKLLENYQEQLGHDTKRYEMLTKAISERPLLRTIEASADTARDEMVKAIADETHGGSVQGVQLSQEIANEISTTTRQQSVEIKISGTYRVAKVDTTVAEGFKVTLENQKTGETIVASLLDALVSSEHRAAIQAAEWKKKPISVEMKARRLRDRVVDATIVDVQQK
jgi:hypothetical protein